MPTYIRLYDDHFASVVSTGSVALDAILNNTHEGEVNTFANLPVSGVNIGDVYVVRTTTNYLNPFTTTRFAGYYFWTGAEWISSGIGLGEIQALISNHAILTNNPHSVTKSQVGLGSVDNTSDLAKPISTLVQAEITRIDADVDQLFLSLGETFESVSKNIKSWNVVSSTTNSLTYSDGIDSITKTITKPDAVTVILTLSGDTPAGIDLVKTITLNTNDLPTWVYS